MGKNLPLQPGPGGSNSAIFQIENQAQISSDGQRATANNYQVDGVSVHSLGWAGAAVITPNVESVKEISLAFGPRHFRTASTRCSIPNFSSNDDLSNTNVFGRTPGGLAGRVVELQLRLFF